MYKLISLQIMELMDEIIPVFKNLHEPLGKRPPLEEISANLLLNKSRLVFKTSAENSGSGAHYNSLMLLISVTVKNLHLFKVNFNVKT